MSSKLCYYLNGKNKEVIIIYTISQSNHHSITEKKSEFICYLYRINDEAEAKTLIQQLKKEHYKARHCCYAYIIDDNLKRSSDDGEPSGTAGIPILETLSMFHLEKTLAVVVRYFGGIKLGAGGLIRAYREATSAAIKVTGIVQIIPKEIIQLEINYDLNDKLQYFLKNNEIPIITTNYLDKVQVQIITDDFSNLQQQLNEQFYNKYTLTKLGTKNIELPLN